MHHGKKLFEQIGNNQFRLVESSHDPNKILREAFEKDFALLQEVLISEGLWDKLKQKVGGALEKTSEKAKQLLLKPLVKVIVDKIAKDDPQGFTKLQQYAQAGKIGDLLNNSKIKDQADKVGKDLATVKESLSEQESNDLIREYINAILEAEGILIEDSEIPASGEVAPPEKKSSFLGKIGKGVDKLGIAAIRTGGDVVTGAGDLAKKGLDTKIGQVAKNAVGGLVSKVYALVKKYPKISATVGVGLIMAVLTAASIGSGGVIPLIMGTLGAGAAGAAKGAAAGYIGGASKDMYRQIKGGADSFTKMNYGDVNKSGIKTGKTGAMIGGAIGAGAHVAGQAIAGVGKMLGGNAAQAATDAAKQGTEKKAQDVAQQGTEKTAKASQNFNTISNAEMAKAAPDANKILDLLQNPQNGPNYGLETWSSDMNPYNRAVRMGYDYQINGMSLEAVLKPALPDGLSSTRYMSYMQKMAETNPEQASKLLSAQIAKGLKMIAANK